jgi:quinol monooxygenase YgiN
MALHVIAQFVALPDKIDAAGDILRGLVEPIRRDPGCIRCHLVVDEGNPASFVYIEEWRDGAALDKHLADPDILRPVERVVPLLAQPFSLHRYRVA